MRFYYPILILPLISSNIYLNVSYPDIDPYEYYTYPSMTLLLHSLAENYSDIMCIESIGSTHEGRDIWMVKLSDNPDIDEEEPGILLMGAHHGNEKPSFEVLIFFIKYMVEIYDKPDVDNDHDGLINEDIIDGFDNDGDGMIDDDPSESRVRDVINNTQIFIVPMVNPDGVEYGWRKNRVPNNGPFGLAREITSYGVDLNRNYGYLWYLPYIFPHRYHLAFLLPDKSWNYHGRYPFSESETKAIKHLVESHNNIRIAISYHSYGEFLFYPWTHTSLPTPDENLFISIGENISKINGYYLYKGKDYIIPRFGGTIGTVENWLYGIHRILPFTIELCKSRTPTNPDIVSDYCWRHVGVNLYICERAILLNK